MNKVIEELIEKWIQDNTPTSSNFSSDCLQEESKDLNVYISENLKTQFKAQCIQNNLTMRSTVCNLIRHWVETETN